MIPDPPRRKDGTCYVYRKPLTNVVPQRGVPPELYEREPFCSTGCARAWYGQPDLDAAAKQRKGATPHMGHASTVWGVPHGSRRGYRLCACDACVSAVKATGRDPDEEAA